MTIASTDINDTGNLTNQQLYNKVKDGVVFITPPYYDGGQSYGSGFIYDDKGHIVTNYHVIDFTQAGKQVTVTLANQSSYLADIIGVDKYQDIAVVKIQNYDTTISNLPYLKLGNSSELEVGEKTIAIGAPYGQVWSVSEGIISALGRVLPAGSTYSSSSPNQFFNPDIIQTDTVVNPGNSGGPLFNTRGEVIGVNSAIYPGPGGGGNIGIAYAIPSNLVDKISQDLISKGYHDHPTLGISGIDITPDIRSLMNLTQSGGVLVTDFLDFENNTAVYSGITSGNRSIEINGYPIKLGGNIITKINDKKIKSVTDIISYLNNFKSVGDSVNLTIVRDNQSVEIPIKLQAVPKESNFFKMQPTLGIIGIDINPEIIKRLNLSIDSGVLVTGTLLNSPAQKGDIRGSSVYSEIYGKKQAITGGDIITKIDDISINSLYDLDRYIDNKKFGDSLNITIIRDHNMISKTIPLFSYKYDYLDSFAEDVKDAILSISSICKKDPTLGLCSILDTK